MLGNMEVLKNGTTIACKEKPDITYPCNWQYKVIGKNPEAVKKAILDICAPAPVQILFSHASSSGKYHSFNAELEIQSEEQRLAIYQSLHNHKEIKIVL